MKSCSLNALVRIRTRDETIRRRLDPHSIRRTGVGNSYLVGCGTVFRLISLDEETLRVDEKGRVTIPARIRRLLGIENIVRARIDDGTLVLEPIQDPLQSLEKLTIKGTNDVQKEIKKLRRAAEKELAKEI